MKTAVIILGIVILFYLWLKWTTRIKGIHIKLTYNQWLNSFDKTYSERAFSSLSTTLAGVKHNDCERVIKKYAKAGDPVMLVPDEKNKFDDTATRVFTKDGWFIGWLPNQKWNDRIFQDLVNGKKWEADIREIREASTEYNFTNVIIDLWEYTEPSSRGKSTSN